MDHHPAPPKDDMPARPRGVAIERTTIVDAPAHIVWSVIADVAGWGTWNPIYPQASGTLVPGGRIELTIRLPGMKPQRSTAAVIDVVQGRAVQFGASAFLGLLYATRFTEVRANGPDRCTVVNGEAFRGPLGGLMAKAIGARIGDGLEQQNQGLKMAAEARRDR